VSDAPPQLPSSHAVNRLLSLCQGRAQVISVSGRAGTGKTTLIHQLRQADPHAKQVVLAPTGVAALNVRGQTIHSFFSLPPRILDAEALKTARPRRLWREIERVIIDEISMVRADVLDAIDLRLRTARKSFAPFGGVQLVLVGDYFQLPPVVPQEEAQILFAMGYPNGFAFSAHVMQQVEVAHLHLNTVHRQTEPRFVELLGELRSPDVDEDTIAEINELCCRDHREGREPMILTGTNAAADAYNRRNLDGLATPEASYQGKATGEFDIARERLPVPQMLTLKTGARVMAVKNDAGHHWVNGSLGHVTGLEGDHVEVRFDGRRESHVVKPQAWEKIRYEWNESGNNVTANVLGAYSPIPLILGWSTTIHKAQGLTLEDVRIDIGRGAFASGQAYVALSRARTLEGLSLARPLGPADFFVDPAIIEHEREIGRLAENLRASLPQL
jgi:ATP-dependent exoDNAse (exonuclease V) alpha subunit